MSRYVLCILIGVSAMFGLSGCGQTEQIEVYTIPKQLPDIAVDPESESSEDVDMTRDRMIAAIVPRGEKAWFFKVAGPNAAVEDQMEEFLALVNSITFNEQDQPTWKLPKGWSQESGSQMRFATLQVPGDDETMELSVIPLPAEDANSPAYILSNVNRWRGQLKLKPITEDQLFDQENRTEETVQLELSDGTKVTLANLVGNLGSKKSNAPFAPFAKGGMGSPKSPQPKPPSGLKFDTPDGWKPSRGTSMSVESFAVQSDGKHVETTVTPLGAGAASLLPNINRWRGQIQMQPTIQADLDKEMQSIKVGGSEGKYVAMHGPTGKSTLGIIVVHGNSAWFFKMTGDTDLAKSEEKNFKAFAESVNFEEIE